MRVESLVAPLSGARPRARVEIGATHALIRPVRSNRIYSWYMQRDRRITHLHRQPIGAQSFQAAYDCSVSQNFAFARCCARR